MAQSHGSKSWLKVIAQSRGSGKDTATTLHKLLLIVKNYSSMNDSILFPATSLYGKMSQ
ncbi:MAG: hypothetical protein HOL98_04665 [Gammaproteobacteria bacterium]|nr:hypothetical protein [Gammaproteobacteria bacterium]MBT5202729.1 hypothetical protein [Gammaproteobacteria bacterium]MBT5603126.1 hypothetical protein [Gammaproteobacteria bacterium]MBT6244001.1 hypothetical protein [Gammaproteobacteria bacterium]